MSTLNDMARSETDVEYFDACDRFFSIHELVALFLHSAPPLVLLKCQRVCKLWNQMIAQSQTCQENMFLKPLKQDFSENAVEPQINPILWECFGTVLAHRSLKGSVSSLLSKYEDIEHLPWARDGTSLEAPARKAYARPEASWRGMYISQPPIQRLDWWHSFTCEEKLPRRTDPVSGWGHQYEHNRPITIGMLWDLVECRLKRGCEAQVLYFLNGSSALEDETALEIERLGIRFDRLPSWIYHLDASSKDLNASRLAWHWTEQFHEIQYAERSLGAHPLPVPQIS